MSTNGWQPGWPTGGSGRTSSSIAAPSSTSADLIRATNRLADFDGGVLVLWSRNPVMPDDHATRLADAATGGTLRYIDDANVLVMLDQPEQTALEIGAFD